MIFNIKLKMIFQFFYIYFWKKIVTFYVICYDMTGFMKPNWKPSLPFDFGSWLMRSLYHLFGSLIFCCPRNQNPKGKSCSWLYVETRVNFYLPHPPYNLNVHPYLYLSRSSIGWEDWRQTIKRDNKVSREKDSILVRNKVWVMAFYTNLEQIYDDNRSRGHFIKMNRTNKKPCK